MGFAAADANLYRYVGNEATTLIDPVGLEPWTSLGGWNPWCVPPFSWGISLATGVVSADDRGLELDRARRTAIRERAINNPTEENVRAALESYRATQGEVDRMATAAEIGVEYNAAALGGGYLPAGRTAEAAFSAAGRAMDRNGLTKAGRAIQKHGDRAGSVFPKSTGSAAARNAMGQEVLDGIIYSTSRTIKPNKYGGIDIWDNFTQRGARFDSHGNFITFLDP